MKIFLFRCSLLALIFNSSFGFDAGFLEVASTRQQDRDTTHYGITVCALCRVTIDLLKTAYKIDVTQLEAQFNETNGQCGKRAVNDIVNVLRKSKDYKVNPWQFVTTVQTIASANTKTDVKEMFNEDSHFDSEQFHGGSHLLVKRYQAALNSILKADNYEQARKTFGEMLHTLQVSIAFSIRLFNRVLLQDFYSHTNFIELNYTSPSDVLGQRLFRKDEYAPTNMRTCTSCRDEECRTKSNLDENIQRKKLLTSGYFIPLGLSLVRKKPPGKCSHGGSFDGSERFEPIGGINKDKLKSIHGHLHYRAAHMAYEATVTILKDFWKKIGNDAFALFLTLKTKLNSLVISIDTACSIADYVEFAKKVSIDIVNQHYRLEFAPHNYILASFNGDKAELVVNSRDPADLTNAIQRLNACQRTNTTMGGMYYHSLIEGLKQCEYATIIYTFTDSPARDAYLKYQARALLRSKRAVIYSFMGPKMKARMFKAPVDMMDPLDGSDNNPDLASMSGGLTYPISVTDQPIISEFILRRLEWNRIQSLVMLKSSSASAVFYVDSSINELQLDISSMGKYHTSST